MSSNFCFHPLLPFNDYYLYDYYLRHFHNQNTELGADEQIAFRLFPQRSFQTGGMCVCMCVCAYVPVWGFHTAWHCTCMRVSVLVFVCSHVCRFE